MTGDVTGCPESSPVAQHNDRLLAISGLSCLIASGLEKSSSHARSRCAFGVQLRCAALRSVPCDDVRHTTAGC